jgi:hypothetical protein
MMKACFGTADEFHCVAGTVTLKGIAFDALDSMRIRCIGLGVFLAVVGLFCGMLAGSASARRGANGSLAPRATEERDRRLIDPAWIDASLHRTLVLSDSSDSYYPLALEISRRERIALVHSLEEIIESGPSFVLWVLSPSGYSEASLTTAGANLLKRGAPAGWGIITGSTLEEARRLYGRSLSGADVYCYVDAPRLMIVVHRSGSVDTGPLDIENLSDVLRHAGYLFFSGHGGGSYWRLDEETLLTAGDIPQLPPLAVTTGACQTFLLWLERPIALGFIDRGAACYSGFLFSPAPYYLFGYPDGFPLRHTWPGFPVGFVVRMQNGATLQSFARFPFYFLLGDPRLAFLQSEPYRLVEDRMMGGVRLLRFADAPAGYLPVRIAGGAGYRFVEVVGVASAGDEDFFYNSKLQTMNFGGDKLLLFAHGGGDFTVRLHVREPFMWYAGDLVTDALDHALVYLPQTGGKIFFIVVAVCILLVTVWFTLHIGLRPVGFGAAFLIGASVAVLKGLYALLRAGRASIVSAPLGVEPHFYIGAFVLAGCGALLFFNVRSRWWKAAAVLVATFPTWAVALFWFAGITYVNLFGAVPHLGMSIYSCKLGLMPALAFAVECIFVLSMLSATAMLVRREAR